MPGLLDALTAPFGALGRLVVPPRPAPKPAPLMPPAQVDQALQQGYDTITGATPAAQPIGPPTVAPAPADMGPPTITPPPASAPDTDPVQAAITAAAQAAQVDPALLRALIHQESNFDPRAVSGAGAQGLGQLMPGTARELGVSDPFDPAQNARAAATYLKNQLDAFGGDIDKALAAYNAGPGAVRQYGGIPPYAETRNYVQRVKAFYDAEKQGALNPFRSTNTNTTSDTAAPPTTNLSADALKKQATAALWAVQQIGSQAWNEMCQLFVEQTYGTDKRFLTAKAASNDLIPRFGQSGADNLKNAPLGALVYFSADPTNGYDGHAGIYVGNGQMVSATPSGVQKTDILGDPYYGQRYVGWAAPPPEWQGRPADGSIADGAQRLVDAFNAGTPAAALTLDPTQQTEAPAEPPPPTDQGTADEAAAAQQRQAQPTDQGEPPKNVSPSIADPTAEAVRDALGLGAPGGTTDRGEFQPKGPSAPLESARAMLRNLGADDYSIDRVLGFRGVYGPNQSGKPTEDVLAALRNSVIGGNAHAAALQRLIDSVGGYRSVDQVMSPPGSLADAERIADITNIVNSDAGLPAGALAKGIDPEALAQSDDPGPALFDQLWTAIAQAQAENTQMQDVAQTFGAGEGGVAEAKARQARRQQPLSASLGRLIDLVRSTDPKDIDPKTRQGFVDIIVSVLARNPNLKDEHLEGLTRIGVSGTKNIGIGDNPEFVGGSYISTGNEGTMEPTTGLASVYEPSFRLGAYETTPYHEIGHHIGSQLNADRMTTSTPEGWGYIAGQETPPSEYAKTSPSEDFAESIEGYMTDPDQFTQKFPLRAAYINVYLSLLENRKSIPYPASTMAGALSPEVVRNVLTRGPLAADNPQIPAVLEDWVTQNPKLAESLGTALGFKWTPEDAPPTHEPWQVWATGPVNERTIPGATDTSYEFNLTMGQVPSEADWNKLLTRLVEAGVIPHTHYYDHQQQAGSVTLWAFDRAKLEKVRGQLSQYGARSLPVAPVQPPAQVSQPTPYEVFPMLFQEVPNAQTP